MFCFSVFQHISILNSQLFLSFSIFFPFSLFVLSCWDKIWIPSHAFRFCTFPSLLSSLSLICGRFREISVSGKSLASLCERSSISSVAVAPLFIVYLFIFSLQFPTMETEPLVWKKIQFFSGQDKSRFLVFLPSHYTMSRYRENWRNKKKILNLSSWVLLFSPEFNRSSELILRSAWKFRRYRWEP